MGCIASRGAVEHPQWAIHVAHQVVHGEHAGELRRAKAALRWIQVHIDLLGYNRRNGHSGSGCWSS